MYHDVTVEKITKKRVTVSLGTSQIVFKLDTWESFTSGYDGKLLVNPSKEELEEMEYKIGIYNKNQRLLDLSKQAINFLEKAIKPLQYLRPDDRVYALWNHESDLNLELLDDFIKSITSNQRGK